MHLLRMNGGTRNGNTESNNTECDFWRGKWKVDCKVQKIFLMIGNLDIRVFKVIDYLLMRFTFD